VGVCASSVVHEKHEKSKAVKTTDNRRYIFKDLGKTIWGIAY
jgi:hypothetical protein